MDPSICVTIDYELYGDGSGSIEQHMLQPASALLSFFSSRNILATFFIEVGELIAMERAVRTGQGPRSLAADLEAVRRQLSQIVAEGHDIQLHLHPQWYKARWSQNTWNLGSSHYSQLQWGEDVFKDLVRQGREYLIAIVSPLRPDYECRIFRAGGFHFDRSETLGRILTEEGIRLDSSTCRGYLRHTDQSSIDYRDLQGYQRPYWRTLDGGVDTENRANLWEIPIWAVQARQWRKITARRFRGLLHGTPSNRRLGPQLDQAGPGLNPIRLIKWMWQVQPLLWDFCVLSGKQLVESFEVALRFHEPEAFLPLVMIGHTKHLRQTAALAELHSAVSRTNRVEWVTMSEALSELDSS